jgi:hypothetical protein
MFSFLPDLNERPGIIVIPDEKSKFDSLCTLIGRLITCAHVREVRSHRKSIERSTKGPFKRGALA